MCCSPIAVKLDNCELYVKHSFHLSSCSVVRSWALLIFCCAIGINWLSFEAQSFYHIVLVPEMDQKYTVKLIRISTG